MLQHWLLTFFGNLAGALFIVGIIIGHGGVLSGAAFKKEAIAIATAVSRLVLATHCQHANTQK